MAEPDKIKSTVIISVYKDNVALALILKSLIDQTTSDFDVIVSEDCESDSIRECLNKFTDLPFNLTHLTQDDDGFRKNIALNRAIKAAENDHLIFIDGDCILHPEFVSAHQRYSRAGIATTGRRLELGKTISEKIRNEKMRLNTITVRYRFLLNSFSLLRDNAKNLESGIYSPWLQKRIQDREIRLLGCNFSCSKTDMLKINGFNQDYLSPGLGEDSDIDWRLVKAGVLIKNVKFSAIQYHLFHERRYSVTDLNKQLFENTRSSETYACRNGIKSLEEL